MSNPTARPLTTNTNFVLSQLPTLKAILADLRPKLARLRNARQGLDSAKDERREERREYIEQRTRLHLERNGDAVMENAVTLDGRKVDRDEIEALEKAASVLKGP